METRASYILVGGFVLGLVAATFAVVIWLTHAEFEARPTPYQIYFTGSVTGLSVGSPVRYRGVPVGSVTEIAIDPENIARIRVRIEVSKGTPIKTDMVASLGVQGITGIAFVQLTGGSQAAPLLVATKRAPIPIIPSEPSGLETLLNRAPQLLEKAVDLLERVSTLFNDQNQEAVTETLAHLRNITSMLDQRQAQIDSTIADAQSTLKSLRETAENLRDVAEVLHKNAGPITGQAMGAIKDVHAITRSLKGVASGLNEIIADNRAPIRDFASNGLYEFSQFVAEARTLVASLTRLSAQIERDPARFFFGDTQKGFEPK